MPTPHKHANIIKAWADGIEIQMKYEDGSWRDLTRNYPTWEAIDYRIKPEPQQIEGWIGYPSGTGHRNFHTNTPDDVEFFQRCSLTIYPDD